ncbi:fungal-specific transcription factor domain-containing protein [Fennellomyces sp. T-0311]|nr:fungal-specific transcription factor domain-containing protein [Fennellomyces sp. T-0311]
MNSNSLPSKQRFPEIRPLPTTECRPVIDIPRQKRSRAKRSCDLCRKRRIRCNAGTTRPCHGCKSLGAECRFGGGENEKKNPAKEATEPFQNQLNRLETVIQTTHDSTTQSKHISPHDLCGYGDLDPVLEMTGQLSKLQLSDYERTRFIGSSAGIHLLDETLFKDNRRYRAKSDPPYIVQKVNVEADEHIIIKSEERKSTPLSIPRVPQSITVLQDVPFLTEELLDIIVHAYFVYIHPHIPILNKLSFLEQYYYQNPQPPDEYLLSALCAVATEFLHYQDDYVAGTNIHRKTVTALKQSLRDKASKIMGIAYKRSQISTVQTLVLLAMFAVVVDDVEEENSAQWIIAGAAINKAQDIGLHRSSTSWDLPEREVELRRRLWYTIYLMDKWIAASLGLPMTIPEDSFDVELPSPYELDSAYHTAARGGPALIAQTEASLLEREPVYGPFLEMVALSKVLEHVLVRMYAPKVQLTDRQKTENVEALDIELNTWRLNLATELQFNPCKPVKAVSHSCVLYIFYNCVMILLHRPFIKGPNDSDGTIESLQSHSVCTTAAVNIIEAIESMLGAGAPYISRSFMGYAVLQASIIFVINAGSEDGHVRRNGCKNLARCAAVYSINGIQLRVGRILDHLSKRYTALHKSVTPQVDYALDRKETSPRRPQRMVTVPMLSSTSAEALFVSSLPREIALFNQLSQSGEAPRPPYEDITVNINPPSGPVDMASRSRLLPDSSMSNTPTIYNNAQHGSSEMIQIPTATCAPIVSLEDTFRQQQIAMSSALELLPIENLPSGMYWAQEEWDGFLHSVGYERHM